MDIWSMHQIGYTVYHANLDYGFGAHYREFEL